jgi:hypothetical protein
LEQEVLYIPMGQSPYHTSFYKMLHRLLNVARRAGDLRVYKDGDLTFGVRPGRVFDGDTLVEFAGAAGQALTNNAANSIYLTAGGSLVVSTDGFPVPSVTPHIRLASIETDAGTYTYADITDCRGTGLMTVARGPACRGPFDWQASVADELDFTAAEPGGPAAGDRYLNTTTGTSSETAQSVTADHVYEWNGTSWTDIAPTEGACCLVEDRDMPVGYSGAAWVDIGTFALLEEAQNFFAATDVSGAEAETLTDGSNADALHVHAGAGLEDGAITDAKVAAGAAIARAKLAEQALTRWPVSLTAGCRNEDGTVLDATGGTGMFSVDAGGWGDGGLTLLGEAVQNTTKTDTLCFEFALPVEYVADEDVRVNVHAHYDDSGGGTSPTCTIDVEAYELTDAGAAGSDLCTTDAQDLTTSFADKTFVLTDADLQPGDRLLVLVRTSVQEGGDAGTLRAEIGSVELQLDVKG